MPTNRNISRPASLRQNHAALAAATLSAASLALSTAAVAQSTPTATATTTDAGSEVELDTLKISGRTADVNPYAEEGAPYKARISGDSRRVRPLAETPTTIDVITEAQIKESGRTDLRTILQLQPGVTIGTGENGNKFGDRYIIRGQELKSDVFVDGLRDPGMTIRESFDVEQVELTKGPSSTFAGRGSSGGAVNSISKKASTEYDFVNFDLTGGTDKYARGTADVNMKVSDEFALRGNLLLGREDVPDRDPANRKRFGAALSALLRPAPNFSVLLDYYHLTAHDHPDLGTFFRVAGGKPQRDIPVYTQKGDFVRSSVNVLTARLRWDLSPTVRIENSGRYGLASNGYVNTGARGATRSARDPIAPGALDITLDNGHQGYQRIRYLVDQLNLFADLNLAGMKHSLVLGGEYSDNRVRNGVYNVVNAGPRNCITGTGNGTTPNNYCILNGVSNIATLQGRSYTKGNFNVDWRVETASAYAMDTVDVTQWLTLFGGARLDHYDYHLITQNPNTLVQARYGYSGNLWNYHGGVSLKPSDDGQLYFSYGTAKNINGGESDVGANCGYGGFCAPPGNTAGGNPNANPNYYGKPVHTTNYEVGAKYELFDHKLLLTAAAFRLYKDGVFQACAAIDASCTSNGYGSQGSLNSGKYRVQGVEFGLVGNITSRLSGQAGITWARSRVLKSTAPAEIGLKLANFANFQANAQLRYQLTDAFAIGGNVNHKSSMAAGQPDTAAGYNATLGVYSFKVPAYTTFDAFASYKLSPHLELRGNVINAGNKDYYLAAYRGGTFVYIGDKRRFLLTLSGKY